MRDTVFLTRHRTDDKQLVIETMTRLMGGARMLDTPANGAHPPPVPESRDLAVVTAAIAATAHATQQPAAGSVPVSPGELLDALVLLRWAQGELASLEPALIAGSMTRCIPVINP